MQLFKDKSTDRLYGHLLSLGIQVDKQYEHPLQKIRTVKRSFLSSWGIDSLGFIQITGKNIAYINIIREHHGSGQYSYTTDYLEYLVPIREIPSSLCRAVLAIKKRGLFRRKLVDVEWHGGTLADELNGDTILNQDLLMAFQLNRPLDITIAPEPIYRCMRVETALHLPSGLLFDCLDRIVALTVKHVAEVNNRPEKVILETKIEFNPRTEYAEVASCYVTEQHVCIESREPLQIPWYMVEDCSSYTPTPSFGVGMPTVSHSTVTLRYRDELGSRQKLEFEMLTTDAGALEYTLRESYPRIITK